MYVIWSIINVAFFIFFCALVLALFTKGKKLFDNKYGNIVIVIFVICVIGMLNVKSRDFENKHTFSNDSIKGYNTKSLKAKIEDNLLFDLYLSVSFKVDDTGKLIPSSSYSGIDGFRSGYAWEYKHANVNKLGDGNFSYEVFGQMHWILFGIKGYTQNKEFSGILENE